MVELTVEQAEEVLYKERSYAIAHGGEYQIEAYNMAIRALNNYVKLENIKQVIKDHDNDSMPEDYFYIDKIREVLNG